MSADPRRPASSAVYDPATTAAAVTPGDDGWVQCGGCAAPLDPESEGIDMCEPCWRKAHDPDWEAERD